MVHSQTLILGTWAALSALLLRQRIHVVNKLLTHSPTHSPTHLANSVIVYCVITTRSYNIILLYGHVYLSCPNLDVCGLFSRTMWFCTSELRLHFVHSISQHVFFPSVSIHVHLPQASSTHQYMYTLVHLPQASSTHQYMYTLITYQHSIETVTIITKIPL
jgi:hypothetical protein